MNIDDLNRYGYYKYKDQIYINRPDILTRMVNEKDYDGDFTFHFNDDFFSKLNWLEEPQFSIETLYKIRAQQLRDKYKYLIVLFSGGSDSYQLLRTFLDNNIFVDEIQCFHHEKGIDKIIDKVDNDILHKADMLEFRYASKPLLERVRKESPNTKITAHDITDFLVDNVAGKKFDHLGYGKKHILMSPFAFNTFPKAYTYIMLKYNEEQNKQRDSVCLVRGIDKPVLNFHDDQSVTFNFFDSTLMTARNYMNGEISRSGTIENFFWSIDCPLIPIKQSHMILNKLKENKKLLKIYTSFKKKTETDLNNNIYNWYSQNMTLTQKMLAMIIYPQWKEDKVYSGRTKNNYSSDFILLDSLGINHHGHDVVKEYREYRLNEYHQLNKKKDFFGFKFSKKYTVGKL